MPSYCERSSPGAPIFERSSEHYEQLLNLYEAVGYAPKAVSERAAWKQQCISAWQIIDRVIPGNTLVVAGDTALTLSIGSIPLSDKVIYGHSMAMRKDPASLTHFLEVHLRGLAMCEKQSQMEYYAVSVRTRGRFVTRLYTSLDPETPLKKSFSYHSLVMVPGELEGNFAKLEIEEVESVDALGAPAWVRSLHERIGRPHPSLRDWYRIRCFAVRRPGQGLSAVLILHSTPRYFTAAEVTRTVWTLVLDGGLRLEDLCANIAKHPELAQHEIDLFVDEGRRHPSRLELPWFQIPVYWYFFHKDDFAAIAASIARATQETVQKLQRS